MKQAMDVLEALRGRIAKRGADSLEPKDREYLVVAGSESGIDLWFHGNAFDESYNDLLENLSLPSVSPWVRALSLSGPDAGANGTKNWDLEPLAQGPAAFERLELLSIQLNQSADHNRSIVGRDYEEDGVIARVLARAPNLRTLQVPSAPDATFFEVPADQLERLIVDAGYATQDFILNLAKSSNLPSLGSFQWGEYHETYMDDWRSQRTPVEHYRELLRSRALREVSRWVLRNPSCTDAQLGELKALRPDLQILVVRTSAEYV